MPQSLPLISLRKRTTVDSAHGAPWQYCGNEPVYRTAWIVAVNHPKAPAGLAYTFRRKEISLHSYTVLIGPGYCATKESLVNRVIPSTVAWAIKILSKGSL